MSHRMQCVYCGVNRTCGGRGDPVFHDWLCLSCSTKLGFVSREPSSLSAEDRRRLALLADELDNPTRP